MRVSLGKLTTRSGKIERACDVSRALIYNALRTTRST